MRKVIAVLAGISALILLFILFLTLVRLRAGGQPAVQIGASASGDWRTDSPGVRRKITVADLPPPYASASVYNGPHIIARPAGATLQVPPGFVVQLFADGLDRPRLVRTAPNGDLFISEGWAGRIRVLRAADGAAKPDHNEIFADHLSMPFGMAFWPPGPAPQFVYIGNTDSVVRFPYRNGDLKARGPAETVIAKIPGGGLLRGGGHWTRNVVFSSDGAKMFVSVGSLSNDAEGSSLKSLGQIPEYAMLKVLGALGGSEEMRADVLQANADASGLHIFASGLRNCVGMAINPANGELWCSTNERDGLGDDLPPDYITSVRAAGFYGWPWYYLGDHEDPRHKGERPDLKGKVIVPDVLLQAHSASLEMTFYQGQQFPPEYRGDAFAAEHGSWNRSRRTGSKIIRVIFRDGKPTGEYEDFLTGFVLPNADVWGRPVGVTVAHDGSLIVTEDANGTVWRISYQGKTSPQQ